MKKYLLVLCVLFINSLAFSQDAEIAPPVEEYQYDETTIITTITNILTNTINVTNVTPVYVTNTLVLPNITPISINACVAILKNRFDDLKLFIERDPYIVTNIRGDGNNLLHVAATRSNIEIIKYLLEKGVDPNYRNNAGRTPLHVAAQFNNIAGASELLLGNALVRVKDRFGHSPVWIANIKNYPQMLKLLATAQIQQPVPADVQEIALSRLNKRNNQLVTIPSNFDLYIRFNQNVIENGPIEDTPWHKALYAPGYEEAQKLVQLGMDVYTTDSKGQNAYHIAALYDNVDAMQYLLSLPFFKTGTTDNFGATPQHTAAGKASPELLEHLINAGCDLTVRNKGGWTAFFEATFLGNHEVVRYLLEKGISPNVRTAIGRTPLHEAARLGYEFIVRDLLEAGASYDLADYQGKTPLYLAAEQGYTDIIAQLHEKGANPLTPAMQELTPLHIAVMNQQYSSVRYLIELADTSILAVDELGRTALDIAYILGYSDIIGYLALKYAEEQIGALGRETPNVVEGVAKTPTDLVVEDGTEAVIEDAEVYEEEYAEYDEEAVYEEEYAEYDEAAVYEDA